MPDAEPDHRHQDLRDRVEVRQPRGEEQDQERAEHRDDREEQGDRRRHEGAEEDEQDHEGCEQADQVADALRRRRALGLAGELDLHACRVADRAQLVLDRHDPGARQLEAELRSYCTSKNAIRPLSDSWFVSVSGLVIVCESLVFSASALLRRLAGGEHPVDDGGPGGRVEPLCSATRARRAAQRPSRRRTSP